MGPASRGLPHPAAGFLIAAADGPHGRCQARLPGLQHETTRGDPRGSPCLHPAHGKTDQARLTSRLRPRRRTSPGSLCLDAMPQVTAQGIEFLRSPSMQPATKPDAHAFPADPAPCRQRHLLVPTSMHCQLCGSTRASRKSVRVNGVATTRPAAPTPPARRTRSGSMPASPNRGKSSPPWRTRPSR